jgi:uncharacterized protein YaiE (UPF0345 family)
MTRNKVSDLPPVKTSGELLRRLRQVKVESVRVVRHRKPGRPEVTVTFTIAGQSVAAKWPQRTPWRKTFAIAEGIRFTSASRGAMCQIAGAVMTMLQQTPEWRQFEDEQSLRSERRCFDARVERLVESAVKLSVDPGKFLEELGKYYRERFVESVMTS